LFLSDLTKRVPASLLLWSNQPIRFEGQVYSLCLGLQTGLSASTSVYTNHSPLILGITYG